MSDRHTSYFELRDAIAADGCVICRLSARSVRRYLEALSFESVNDYGLRRELRLARGFCGQHAWQVLDEVRDPFGAGIIYRDVLNECRRLLEAGSIGALRAGAACLACLARDRAAARYVEVLAEHLGERSLSTALVRAGGLCWAHVALGVARAGRRAGALISAQREALEAMRPTGVSAPRVAIRSGPPPAGVRAGTAAPRGAPAEEAADPVIAAAVGLPSLRGEPALEGAAKECAVCLDALAAARLSAGEVGRRSIEGAATSSSQPLPLVCSPHAWLAADLAGSETVRAMLWPRLSLLIDLLEVAARRLASAMPVTVGPLELVTPTVRRVRQEVASDLVLDTRCEVCEAQRRVEERSLPEAAAGPICRPHLLATRADPQASALETTLGTWRGIVADLDEYIRKNDYRFRDEPRGPEQRSPWRAVAQVAGARGVR